MQGVRAQGGGVGEITYASRVTWMVHKSLREEGAHAVVRFKESKPEQAGGMWKLPRWGGAAAD